MKRVVRNIASQISIPLIALCVIMPVACAQSVSVQPAPADVWTHTGLVAQSAQLPAKAEQTGGASIKLTQYSNHFTMLAYHSRSGGAEVHENLADFFVIVKGSATLLSGGAVVDPKTTAPGEILGASLTGATSRPLHAGDIVHIPAGTPHQLILKKGQSLTYYVIKVRER